MYMISLTDSENEKQESPFQKPWSYIPARVRPTGDDDLHDTLRFG
jgi:hypothetical protein